MTASTKVSITPSVLAWAIKRRAFHELIQRFPKLPDWQSGVSQPTLKQVEDLATATHTPLGFFFLASPPEEVLPIPHYRTHDNQVVPGPSVDLAETVQNMKLRQDWMREYLIDQRFDKLPIVGCVPPNQTVEGTANDIRIKLGLLSNWASACKTWTEALVVLRTALEDAGINVVINGIVGNNTHRKLDPKEFRGFVLVDEYAPLIFINGADSKAAQMFSMAHEAAHVWLGVSAAFDLSELEPANDKVELFCNTVAAEFLVPEIQLRGAWPAVANHPNKFEELARTFKVSQLVMARRALDLQLITKPQFLRFYQEYQQSEFAAAAKSTDSGGNFYATQNQRIGRLFGHTVARAAKEGKLLYRDAYRLTGLNGKTYSEFVERLK